MEKLNKICFGGETSTVDSETEAVKLKEDENSLMLFFFPSRQQTHSTGSFSDTTYSRTMEKLYMRHRTEVGESNALFLTRHPMLPFRDVMETVSASS